MQRQLIVVTTNKTWKQVSQALTPGLHLIRPRESSQVLSYLQGHSDVYALITEESLDPSGGVALLEAVRAHRPDVRRILLTAYSNLTAVVLGLHSGAIQYLVQLPIQDAELLEAVRSKGS